MGKLRQIWDKITFRGLAMSAVGVGFLGSLGIYGCYWRLHRRLRQLPHYQETYAVISVHKEAQEALGPPIRFGIMNMDDRAKNHIDQLTSRLTIPVSGKNGTGFAIVDADRKSPEEKFKVRKIKLLLGDDTFLLHNDIRLLQCLFGNSIFVLYFPPSKLMWFQQITYSLTEVMAWPEFMQPYIESFVQWVNGVLEYWDLQYLEYLLWLFLPIFIAFVLPIILLFLIYGTIIFLHVYGLRNRIREAYASSYWDGARTSIASFWDGVGALWHGYEIDGLEHIPDEGPALLVVYHGTLPLDLYYIIAKGILYKKRTIHCVGDKFVFKMPGWGKICKVFCITPGTIEDCVATLKEGHLLIIAPGGVREALFSSSATYQIMWGKRLGFAKVVLGANVPVIPIFTENCRDAFRTPRWGRKIFRILYEKTRLPVCPIYGGFPVKMITHLGPPIYFNQTSSPEQVKAQVKRELTALIRYHQLLPGSIIKGMLQRIRKKAQPKEDSLLRADQQRANGACSTESEGEFELSLNRSELPCIPLPDADSDFCLGPDEEDEIT